MTKKEEWQCAPVGTEMWSSTDYFPSKEDAIRAGIQAIQMRDRDALDLFGVGDEEEIPTRTFAIGKVKRACLSLNVESLLEYISEDTYEACEQLDIAEDYLNDVTDEHAEELEELIYSWFERHNYLPSFYRIVDIKTVEVPNERD